MGEEESGQVELRFDLAGVHHRERTAQAQERHAGHHDPLQEQQRDDPERHAGPDAVRDLGWPAGHPADQGRQGEGARGHRHRSARKSCRTCRAWRKPATRRSTPSCSSGYFAAAGTPPAIVAKLEAESAQGDHRPGRELQAQGHGGDAGRQPSADFRAMIDTDIKTISRRDQGGEPEVRQLDPAPYRLSLMPRRKRGMSVLATQRG